MMECKYLEFCKEHFKVHGCVGNFDTCDRKKALDLQRAKTLAIIEGIKLIKKDKSAINAKQFERNKNGDEVKQELIEALNKGGV